MNRVHSILVPGRLKLLFIVLVAALSQTCFILAQEQQPAQSQNSKRDQLQRQLESITPQRKTELRKFVRENMPELAKLMSVLNERNPAQFQRLLVSLNQTYQKLQGLKKSGNEAHYAAVLENWKLDTRIKMLSAQMSFREMPNAENRLERLIVSQVDNRKEIIRQEKAKLEARIKKLESNLSRLENDPSGEVERRLKAALKSSENMRAMREASKNESRSESENQSNDDAGEESSQVPRKKPNRNRQPKSNGSESADFEPKGNQ